MITCGECMPRQFTYQRQLLGRYLGSTVPAVQPHLMMVPVALPVVPVITIVLPWSAALEEVPLNVAVMVPSALPTSTEFTYLPTILAASSTPAEVLDGGNRALFAWNSDMPTLAPSIKVMPSVACERIR